MNKTYIYLGLIILMVFLNIWLLSLHKSSKRANIELSYKNGILKQTLLNKGSYINMLKDNITLSLASELSLIDFLKETKNNNTPKFKSIINNPPKLFFKYSELSCSLCVDEQFKALKKLSKKLGQENIVLIAPYKKVAYLKRFVRINSIKFNIVNIDNIGLPVEKTNIPFYFIYDGSKYAKLVFVPRKEMPALTEKYFEIIANRFF